MPKKIDTAIQIKPQIRDALRDAGRLIAEARKGKGWSQTDLGSRLGDIDRRHVSAMEKGDPNVSFGLVAATLWLLDLPILATLPEAGRPDTRSRLLTGTGARRIRPEEVDNDF